jgi:hypothetical protein
MQWLGAQLTQVLSSNKSIASMSHFAGHGQSAKASSKAIMDGMA